MNVLFEKTLFKGKGHWTIKAVEGYTGGMGMEDGYLISYATKEGGKEVVKFNATKGKNKGRSNATTPGQQAVLEAQSRVEKQIDKGYVETRELAGEPVTNALGKRRPQLSLDLRKFKGEVDWETAYLQPKLDGHRCMHDEFIYSRGGQAHEVPHIQAALQAQPALQELLLDGELYIHGVNLQAIGSLITKPRLESAGLEYWIYDLVSDQPFEERYAALQRAFQASPTRDARLKLVPTFKVNSLAEARALHQEFVKQGYEGSILRWGKEGYQDDKRSSYSLKLKDFQDSEFKVVGHSFGLPNGDLLNPNWVYEYHPFGDESQPLQTAEVLAPGTHHDKHQQGLNPESYYGKMLTLEHMGYTNKGTPNIATAKGWLLAL